MINFNFTLDDEETTWLFDLLHEEKCRLEKEKFQAENIDKNVNMARYFENQLKYLANMRKKMLDGQTKLEEEKSKDLKIICRDRMLTDAEAAKYKKIREEIDKDLPDLIEQAKKSLENLDNAKPN